MGYSMGRVLKIDNLNLQMNGLSIPNRPAFRPVRVCFLIDRLAMGGTETQLLALIRNLDRSKVQPFLVLLDGEDDISKALEPTDCRVVRLGLRRLMSLRSGKQVLRFRQFLKSEQIDVLQPYFPDSTYFGVLVGQLAGVRSIIRTRNNNNHWMNQKHRLLGRFLNGFVTQTVCNSNSARKAVYSDEKPDPDSVIVIENGVDLERFAQIPPIRGERTSDQPCRVGMVANLRFVKGVDIFLKAAAILAKSNPNTTFHVAGEGPQRPELENLIEELGLKGRFILHGVVTDIPGFLGKLDVAVLSSRSEGMPNAVLEYMAAGRAIVATSIGGVTDLVTHEASAWLVPPESPERLADGLFRLLHNPGQAAALATTARNVAWTRYSRNVTVGRFEHLFAKCKLASDQATR